MGIGANVQLQRGGRGGAEVAGSPVQASQGRVVVVRHPRRLSGSFLPSPWDCTGPRRGSLGPNSGHGQPLLPGHLSSQLWALGQEGSPKLHS